MEELTVYVDGASRGNPGKAGIGVIFYDSDKNVLKKIKRYLGNTTNNAAEYLALICALQEGIILRVKRLNIYSDSELVVRQLQGRYKIKNELLRIFYGQVEHLQEGFDKVIVRHIAREMNKEADELANQAIDMSS